MPERILLIVDREPGWFEQARWTLGLARRLGARVIAASLMDGAAVADGPDPEERVAALEEQAWKRLYEIEDAAFEQDVKISLLIDQGPPLELLIGLVASYEAGIVVLGVGGPLTPAAVLERCPVPVVFMPEPKEG
jgi:hypothetical protein